MKNYIKITNGNSVILTLEAAKDFLDEIINETGNEYEIKVVEMNESDFLNLPEFTGF